MPSLSSKSFWQLCLFLASLAGCLLVTKRAWVAEDAFITFRVVDQFVQGHGLRWNSHERVQVYTHPLWLFLHIPFYGLFKNIWLVNLGLSLVCALGSAVIAAKTFSKRPVVVTFLFILPLMISQTAVDYATSGLETPLSFLLWACFGWTVFKFRAEKLWLPLGFIVSLALVNRLDLFFFFGPLMAFWLVRCFRQVKWRLLALGSLPLVIWEVFSLWYYGFPFPNTKYAKLNTGIAAEDYVVQGWRYLLDLGIGDSPSLIIMVVAVATAAVRSRKSVGPEQHPSAHLLPAVAVGILGYVAYILWVGGDFMSGRFFAFPIFVAVWLIYAHAPPRNLKFALPFFLIAALIGGKWLSMGAAGRLRAEHPFKNTHGIADERAIYQGDMAFFPPGKVKPRWRHGKHARVFKDLDKLQGVKPTAPTFREVIGIYGFYAPTDLILVDQLALCDPLLARLPTINPKQWRIGHFGRRLPKGYLHALETGNLEKMHPSLAAYYQRLSLITRGNLWNWKRLQTLVGLNLGLYDHYLDDYLSQTDFEHLDAILVVNHVGDQDADIRLTARDMEGNRWESDHRLPVNGFISASLASLFPQIPPGHPFLVDWTTHSGRIRAGWVGLQGEAPRGSASVPATPVDTAFRDWEPHGEGSDLRVHVKPDRRGRIQPPVWVNVGDGETQVGYSLFSSSGRLADQGQIKLTTEAPFAEIQAPVASDDANGFLFRVVSAQQPIAAIGQVRAVEGHETYSPLERGNVIGFYADRFPSKTEGLLYAWISNNDEFQSMLLAHNPEETQARVQFTARRSDGSQGTAFRIIPPFGFIEESAASLFPELVSGGGYSVTLISSGGQIFGSWQTVNQRVSSRKTPSSGLAIPFSKTMGGQDWVGRVLLFGFLPATEGLSSAAVLVNLGENATDVALQCYGPSGKRVFLKEPFLRALPPLRPRVVVIRDHLPISAQDIQLIVTSSGEPIAGVALIFNYGYQPALWNATALD